MVESSCTCSCHSKVGRKRKTRNLATSTVTAPRIRSWKAYCTRSKKYNRPFVPSTPPSKIRKKVLTLTWSENQFPIPPDGFYYLVDSGFPCSKGYLPPYRGERYHLQQFRNSGDLVGFKELFNYRHSSLRMVIERCSSVLKSRFHVQTRMPKYKVARQPILVNACVTLHNYIRLADRDDVFFAHAPPVEPLDGDGLEYGHIFDFSKASSIAMTFLKLPP
ncbi:uncharacterized protein LOC132164253 isoform X2 [Corylus avellana]|uniref:uncharacterized protein LOC132164253 isoform X2 n=1 Tax=Corylus avellana TaxID=13451 RepID=UPI00286C5CBB|nr:uncharacterized protein LOC132164253 isoform X2 [Corylus avellana]